MHRRSIIQIALWSLLTAAAWGASPTADALSAEMQVEFDAAGLAFREAMTLKAAGHTVDAAEAERSAQAHRAHYLALRQRLNPTPAISTGRDPFSPDASWWADAKPAVAAEWTTRPRWDLYGLSSVRERQVWDLYARGPSGELVNRQPAAVRAQRPDVPDEAPPSSHQTSAVPTRETP